MKTSDYNLSRVRDANSKDYNIKGKFILYWMQSYRRLNYNHTLDYSISLALETGLPLVVYEGIRMNYPWASERIHKFILEGICDNFISAQKLGITYWPYVETPKNKDKDLLFKMSQSAYTIITDDFPCFIIPNHIQKVSERSNYKVIAIDGNCIAPISKYGEFASAARILRPRIHSQFSEAYINRAQPNPKVKNLKAYAGNPPFEIFSGIVSEIPKVLGQIPFKQNIKSVDNVIGGRREALKILNKFINNKLGKYSVERSNPNSPDKCATSGLSPYIHFGYISIDEILEETLNYNSKQKWAPDLLNFSYKGKRELFFHKDEFINSFLDELLTWRDIGFLLFYKNPSFNKDLSILPDWVKTNLDKHSKDKRPYLYTKEQFENCNTHDKLWNSAQKELMLTGRMHNYMRMLWGKKVMEWTSSYEEAFSILEDFNNKYAYDGRNPNSYTGILWCFGLFDRPWFPERPVFGNLRFMSSDSTMKKFKMTEYLQYINSLEGTKETLFG